jgi:hypothetical protein
MYGSIDMHLYVLTFYEDFGSRVKKTVSKEEGEVICDTVDKYRRWGGR